jgi:hypothetical protein
MLTEKKNYRVLKSKLRKFLFYFVTVFLPTASFGSITVDLVCTGTSRIILDSKETKNVPWSQTFSISNGFSGDIKWSVTDRMLRSASPTSFPVDDRQKVLYEKVDHNIEIDRISGKVTQRFIFTINKNLQDVFGTYRYQIDEGDCKLGQKTF